MANKRKCRHCQAYTHDFIVVRVMAFCNFDHAAKYAYANKEKGYAIKKKQAKKRILEKKQALKPRREWIAEAQRAFNKYIRIRDTADSCISCNRSRADVESEQGWKVGGCWDAGHFKARGVKQQLRFNTFNCHKQCKSCNGGGKFSHKAATVDKVYKINLIKKIGLARVEALEGNNELENQDIDYLKRVKRIFNKRARHIAKLRGE